MRAIWKGAIAFGLVNVPVKVYSATEDHDISLHQVHNADGGRIRYQRRCEVCSKIVDYEDIDKAYEDDGRTVVLTEDELKSHAGGEQPRDRGGPVRAVDQLDPMMFEKSYYLEPDSKSPKAYVLLRRALEDTDRVAIVQFALRDKTRLGALRIRGQGAGAAVAAVGRRGARGQLPAPRDDVRISAAGTRRCPRRWWTPWPPTSSRTSSRDDYQEQLRQLIDAKLEQGDSLDTEETFGDEAESRRGRGDRPDGGAAAQRGAQPGGPHRWWEFRRQGHGEEGGRQEDVRRRRLGQKAPAKKKPAKKAS